ncbi:MAG: PIN domain-containing protein, partial [Selenomonadaceae bacterium]|nr:PIN domain-containing protein [Selenomonadaceae bacterium]
LIARQDIIIGGNILRSEIDKIKDVGKKLSVISLYMQAVTETVAINEEVINRAKKIMEQANIKQMDALHLSCAISGNADIFLTVDDKLIKACRGLELKMVVANPVCWESEL